jgi:hypothetical protein
VASVRPVELSRYLEEQIWGFWFKTKKVGASPFGVTPTPDKIACYSLFSESTLMLSRDITPLSAESRNPPMLP